MHVGVLGSREAVKEDTGDEGREGHCALAADVGEVDHDPGEQGAGDTADGGDGVVAVGLVDGGVRAEVLGEEGVEEGVSQSDAGPAEPDQDGGQAETLGGEERSNLLDGEAGQRPLDDLCDGQLFGFTLLGNATEFVEQVNGEPGGGLVLAGNSLDSSNGLILATAGDEELGGLVEGEQEEATQEHGEGDGTQGEDEVSPAPVVSLKADGGAVITGEVGDESPGKHTGNQGSNRPPGRQSTEDIARVGRETLAEDSCIYGQITANTKSNARVQGTSSETVSTGSLKQSDK